MFNFLHPQSVASRKPVAVMIVRQNARASIHVNMVLYAKPNCERQVVPFDEVKAANRVDTLRQYWAGSRLSNRTPMQAI
jgi:hypothetical protein